MSRKCYLFRDEHIPAKPAFPVVDAHNHLWFLKPKQTVDDLIRIMDEVGIVCYCDLTANAKMSFGGDGYQVGSGSIEDFFTKVAGRYPGRIYGFTMSTLCRPRNQPLFDDAERFVDDTIALMRKHVSMGARGFKVLKELGLHYRDARGRLVHVDDPRLGPIWDEPGKLGVPVLIHQSDPYGFFQPNTPENEHYDSLAKYPDWCFGDPKFPSKEELLERRDRMVQSHPETTFILPHGANFVENLGYVSKLLEDNPNVYIDFSARFDELGRQPYTARDFFLRHQDRILFGSDMPASVEMYRFHYRFLETFDEYFIPPDYDGTFGRHRWKVFGIGLPGDVLAKVYHKNALKVIPGLKDAFNSVVGSGGPTSTLSSA